MGNWLPHIEWNTANKNLRIHCQDSIYWFHQKNGAPFLGPAKWWSSSFGSETIRRGFLYTPNIIVTGFVYYHYMSVYYMLYIHIYHHLPFSLWVFLTSLIFRLIPRFAKQDLLLSKFLLGVDRIFHSRKDLGALKVTHGSCFPPFDSLFRCV